MMAQFVSIQVPLPVGNLSMGMPIAELDVHQEKKFLQ
jgi:hypothetical protein